MGLAQERNGRIHLGGPGSLVHAGLFLGMVLLCAIQVVVILHEGRFSGLDLGPLLFSGLLTLVILVSFDSSYVLDIRRREILRCIRVLRGLTWTRKLADFSDIRGAFLGPPLSNTTCAAFLDVLLPSGRSLTLRLGSREMSGMQDWLREFLERYQIEPWTVQQEFARRRVWEAAHPATGCLVSLAGCILPFLLGLGLCLAELVFPHYHSQSHPWLVCALLSLVFLGPLCSSGWRLLPEENRLETFFQLGPWRYARGRPLDGFQLEVVAREAFELQLQVPEGPSFCLGKWATREQAEEAQRLLQERL